MKRFSICICFVWIMSAVSLWAADITYTDKMGRVVNIPVPVKRAVLFQPNELIPALGIWDKIVGIGRYAYDSDLMKATKPDIERTIPSAGSGSDINIEVLLKVNPDLVVTWSYYPDQVKFMEAKGLKVIALYLDTIPEMYEVMGLLGKLFSKEKRMEYVISQMEGIFNLIKQRVSKIPAEKRKKVLWLYGKQTQVSGNSDLPAAVIKLIGGVNAAITIDERHADVSVEQIVSWNPDVIFIWGNANYEAKDILNNTQWRHVRAVKNGMVYKTPKWSTWSPRLAPMALWMAKRTYPDYFKDVDLEKISDKFFRNVFGISYAQVLRFKD